MYSQVTASGSGEGVSGSVTVYPNGSFVKTVSGGFNTSGQFRFAVGVYAYHVLADGSTSSPVGGWDSGSLAASSAFGPNNNSASGNSSLAGGSWIVLAVVIAKTDQSNQTQEVSRDMKWIMLPAQTYEASFNIPANNSAFDVVYNFYQNGVLVGTQIMLAGAAAMTKTIDGLPTQDPLTATVTTSDFVYRDGNWVMEPGAGQTTAIPGSITPQAPNSSPTAPPVTPTPLPPPVTPSNPVKPTPNTPTPPPSTPNGNGIVNSAGTVFINGNANNSNTYNGQSAAQLIDLNAAVNKAAPTVPDETTDINARNNAAAQAAQDILNNSATAQNNLESSRNDLASLAPTIPTITGTKYVYNYTFEVLGRTFPINYNLEPYSAAISLMRNILKMIFLVSMWVLYTRTLRSSVAG